MNGALWTLVLLPAATGGLLAVAGGRLERAAVPVSVGVSTVVLALSAALAAGRPVVEVPFIAGSTFGLRVDGLAALVLPAVAAVTLLVLVFAAGDVRESPARFHGLMLLFAASALVTVAATTLPTLLVAWELMGATSYALIGFWWREEHRMTSGLTAFVTTRTADLGLYAAAGAALAGGAGLALPALSQASGGWRDAVAAGVLVAALGKAAQLPFSFWLSRAMDGPSPVSALLHSAAMVAMGGYLLLRTAPLLEATGWAATAAAWAGVLTAVLLGAVAVAQDDLKQLLAASTSAQLGFVVMGAGVGAVSGGATQLVAHAATKSLLFLAAGAWLGALGTKRLDALRGAARAWPLVGAAATLGALSLAGAAPLALWATKDAVLAGALHESTGLYAAGLLAVVLGAGYSGRMLVLVWRRPTDDARAGHDEERQGNRHVGWPEKAPLVPLAAGATALGVLALPPLDQQVRHLLGRPAEVAASGWEMGLSAGLALLVVGGVVVRPDLLAPFAARRTLRAWLALEPLAHAALVRPTLALGVVLARFDDRVLDRVVTLVAHGAGALARGAGRLDVRAVDGLVEGLAAGVRRLGRLARRPQTGLLHQYYIQAVSLIAAAVVVLVAVR